MKITYQPQAYEHTMNLVLLDTADGVSLWDSNTERTLLQINKKGVVKLWTGNLKVLRLAVE